MGFDWSYYYPGAHAQALRFRLLRRLVDSFSLQPRSALGANMIARMIFVKVAPDQFSKPSKSGRTFVRR